MPLDYRTALEYIMPRALFEDSICGPLLAGAGLGADAVGNQALLFVDPRTVAALIASPACVQNTVVQAGIGLKPWEGRDGAQDRQAFAHRALLNLAYAKAENHLEQQEVCAGVTALMAYVSRWSRGIVRVNGFPMVSNPNLLDLIRDPADEPFDQMAMIDAIVARTERDAKRVAPSAAEQGSDNVFVLQH
ncbi:MAG: hypothetical protein MK098_12770 [Marinovum sp.]|nr:hypothetical protein [Marinovum sp.]